MLVLNGCTVHVMFLARHSFLLYFGFQQQVIDASRFDEFKALYGETLVTGKVKQSDISLFQAVMCDFVAAV